MRKIEIFVVIILAIFILTACDSGHEVPETETPVQENVLEAGEFIYRENFDGSLALKKYNGSSAEVTVPAEHNGKKITTVAAFAFKENAALVKVTLQEGVSTIEECAFAGCFALADIVLPESAVNISKGAFEDTVWYQSFPDGFVSVNGTILEYKGMPENLASLEIPEGSLRIGDRAFYGLAFKSVMIPDSVVSIGERAFNNCASLMKIRIPKGLTDIGYAAFHGTAWFNMHSGPVVVGDVLIGFKTNGNAAVVPTSVKTIAPGAFLGSSVIAVSLPNGVETVCDYAFSGCTQIAKISLPASVSFIGEHAFELCPTLVKVEVSESNQTYGYENGALYNKNDGRVIFKPAEDSDSRA